jgi:hypothetical protein
VENKVTFFALSRNNDGELMQKIVFVILLANLFRKISFSEKIEDLEII